MKMEKRKANKALKQTKPLPAKSLQKFTNSETLCPNWETVLNKSLENDEPKTREWWDSLTAEQKSLYRDVINAGLNVLALDDRDRFIKKFDVFFDTEDSRNQLWNFNHTRILRFLHNLMLENRRMPTRLELSEATGLSRQTINKHLSHYFESSQFKEKQEEYLLLRERIMAKVYNYAIGGDVRACKLFLDATDSSVISPVSIKNQQNNFIQINGTNVTEEQIKLLPEKQQRQLHKILQPVLHNSTMPAKRAGIHTMPK
jgi:hypothetical protein